MPHLLYNGTILFLRVVSEKGIGNTPRYSSRKKIGSFPEEYGGRDDTHANFNQPSADSNCQLANGHYPFHYSFCVLFILGVQILKRARDGSQLPILYTRRYDE